MCKYINMNVCRQCRCDFLKGQKEPSCVSFSTMTDFGIELFFSFFTAEVKDADELASILHDVRP